MIFRCRERVRVCAVKTAFALLAGAVIWGSWGSIAMPEAGDSIERIAFSALTGWDRDDHGAALKAFQTSCRRMADHRPKTRALGIDGDALAALCPTALALDPADDAAARRFFEDNFTPLRFSPDQGAGFVTGYYEPEVAGSRQRTDRFTVPLYGRPDDLVDIRDHNRPAGFDPAYAFARATAGGLVPYFDRGEIEDGALHGRGLELVYIESAVDAFFIHVQGSARIRLTDGSVMRLTYAAKAGHPYSSIARVLCERTGTAPADMTADKLRAWLEANPDDAPDLMRQNRSFIFFRAAEGLDPKDGPVAAAGVPLTAGRSLAVDRTLHTFGTPVFLQSELPLAAEGLLVPFNRLMIAQDT
ncbi:MAG: MltA domain-containing protein, partial [Hyphomicrobiales bacterium]|nr:MltA domain-containing protein [Hyphomicrobiales bacterium]